jgi:c-di-GMP-binding flagellar brake protein YcgR
MQRTYKGKDVIRLIFEKACARREMLIFVSPYLRFTAHVVHLEGNEVHARVAMGRGDAVYALRGSELKMRFPNKSNVLEAPLKVTGFGMVDDKKTIKFALPQSLYENDDRKAYRVEQVGDIDATVSTQDHQIIDAALVDISASGAKLRVRLGQSGNPIKAGDDIRVTIAIPTVATINSAAKVHYVDEGYFGLEYIPKLGASVMDPLASWIFRKREMELQRMAFTPDSGPEGAAAGDAKEEEKVEIGILLITRDDGMERLLNKALADGRQFYRVQPAVAALKKTLEKKPHLVILHIADTNMEERRLLKSLVATVPRGLPILLLSTDVENNLLFEMGQEWKVAATMAWTKERGPLLQRLVLGMLRRHYQLV